MAISATSQLAEFISSTRTLPPPVSDRAALHIADTLACIYSGSASQAVAVFARVCAPPDENAKIVVPGWGRWNDPGTAAMLIGICAHADDFDDTSEHSMNGHPSAPIVSALIPTASMLGSTGVEVVRAYAVGIEVACKLGSAVGSAHTRRGWHTMSTLGALGGAAAAANLRGLNAGQAERALAIACSFAGGILGNTGTMTKSLHCGRAAQAGYIAAALAGEGFTAGTDILEGEASFLDTFTDRSLTKLLLAEMDEVSELLSPGLAVKLYPCCSCTHKAIDGALELKQTHEFDAESVDQVTCTVREECTHYLRFPDPKTGIQAKFSMNYTVAVALARGKVTLDDFETLALARSTIADLVPKVRMVVPADERQAGGIEVVMRDGRCFATHRSIPRGAPENPPTWNDIGDKLRDCLERSKEGSCADRNGLFAGLRTMTDLPRFTELLEI